MSHLKKVEKGNSKEQKIIKQSKYKREKSAQSKVGSLKGPKKG